MEQTPSTPSSYGTGGSISGDVRLFRHQVGGRCPLLSSATYTGTILKPALKREQGMYLVAMYHSLLNHVMLL
jgi:hypothetical protein